MRSVPWLLISLLCLTCGCNQQPPAGAVVAPPPAVVPTVVAPPTVVPGGGVPISNVANVPAEPPARVKPAVPSEARTILDAPYTVWQGAQKLPLITLAPAPSYFLEINSQVYDVRTGEPVGKRHDYVQRFPEAPTALSYDGKYLAIVQTREHGAEETQVMVSETESGSVIHKWKVPSCGFLAFSEQNQVFALGAADRGSCLYVWDVDTGNKLHEIPGEKVTYSQTCIDRKGKKMAVLGPDGPVIFDIEQKKVLAAFRSYERYHQFWFGQFTPNGEELWWEASTGNSIYDIRGKAEKYRQTSASRSVTVLPDGSGVTDGSIAWHRRNGVVWSGTARMGQCLGMLGDEYFVYKQPLHKTTRIYTFRWPWKQIEKSLEAFAKGDGIVMPGQEVSLLLDVGEVRFADKDEVYKELGAALEKRLAEKGFRVVENAPLKIIARYAEAAAGPLLIGGSEPIYKSHMAIVQEIRDPLNRNREATIRDYEQRGIVRREGGFMEIKVGQHVLKERRDSTTGPEDTNISMHLVMQRDGSKEVLWRHKCSAAGGLKDGDPVTPESLRNSKYQNMKAGLGVNAMPFFIPRDEQLVALPLIEPLFSN